ncbi:MAG: hypothetical protein EHM35_00380 [Planctomycetaceae bacterium]|nr:MAG: hypothetical protein EHM35_00380 [Planctomycetaceae bacterium]
MDKNVVAIYCKDCGALFYANSRILPEDVLDIAKYAREGHRVALVTNATIRECLACCHCESDAPANGNGGRN